MKTITQQIKVYTFEELPKETQAKTLDHYRDWNVNSWNDGGWAEYLLEEEKAQLQAWGYLDAQIYFSGFWSQGDGASFECKIDLEKWLKAKSLSNKYRKALNADKRGEVTMVIKKSGHYEHEYTMSIEHECWTEGKNYEAVQTQLDELEDLILEDARGEAKRIYKALEKEYEYLTSDEAITESFLTNEYEFTEDGRIYN